MIEFIAIAFVLYSAFFIGQRISASVPDEVPRATKYVDIGIDALIIVMAGLAFSALGYTLLAVVVPLCIIIARAFTKLTYAYAPLSGILIGITASSGIVLLLCLVLNFLIGARARNMKDLLVMSAAQPILAVLLVAIRAYIAG